MIINLICRVPANEKKSQGVFADYGRKTAEKRETGWLPAANRRPGGNQPFAFPCQPIYNKKEAGIVEITGSGRADLKEITEE
jgi:hypothetical protein